MAKAKDSADLRQSIIDQIAHAVLEKEIVVRVRGPFATSVLDNNDQYKSKAVQPDTELLFKGVRLGARSPFVFEFEPVAFTEFKRVEFEERKMFLAIPDFEQTLVNALGFYEEITWAQAKSRFMKEAKAREELAKKAELEAEIERQSADELWGMF